MAKFEELVLLVNSLTKAEKRYFKLFTSIQEGDKNYLTVFSLIEKGTLDRNQIKEAFLVVCPKGAFEVSLNYLLKVILKSLRYSESQEHIDSYLLGQLLDIQQLYKKGIYKEFLNQIEKFKELSLKYEKNYLYLEASYLEMEYFTRLNFPEISEDTLIDSQNKLKNTIDSTLKENEHLTLYQLLLHRFLNHGVARSDSDMMKLNDLVLTENALFGNGNFSDSFQSKQLHLLFQSVYFKVIGSPELSLEIYHDLDKLFQENKLLWERKPLYYVFLLEGVLLNLIALKEYASMPYFIDRLKQIQESTNEEIQVRSIIYQFELLFFVGIGNFVEAIEKINKNILLVKELKSAGSPYAIKLEYCQALVYFGLSDWRNCLRSFHFITTESDESLKEYSNLARLIALLVHYEKQDYDYLEHEIRAFERALKKQRSLYKLEKALFELLRGSINAVGSVAQKEIYVRCKTAIEALKEDKYEGRLISLFDFLGWLDAKINDVPYAIFVKGNTK